MLETNQFIDQQFEDVFAELKDFGFQRNQIKTYLVDPKVKRKKSVDITLSDNLFIIVDEDDYVMAIEIDAKRELSNTKSKKKRK